MYVELIDVYNKVANSFLVGFVMEHENPLMKNINW